MINNKKYSNKYYNNSRTVEKFANKKDSIEKFAAGDLLSSYGNSGLMI